VTDSSDDDALSWGDEDDPTLHAGSSSAKAKRAPRDEARTDAPTLPEGYTAVGKGSEGVRASDAGTATSSHTSASDDSDGSPTVGSAALVGLGVLGGIYLLYTIGWVISGIRLRGTAQYLVSDVMASGSFWVAVAAPALWFATTWYATRQSAMWQRFLWLIAGAVLLVPWPLLMIGGVR
jgi:hypothetical protein